jgi:hypothetical protein
MKQNEKCNFCEHEYGPLMDVSKSVTNVVKTATFN